MFFIKIIYNIHIHTHKNVIYNNIAIKQMGKPQTGKGMKIKNNVKFIINEHYYNYLYTNIQYSIRMI